MDGDMETFGFFQGLDRVPFLTKHQRGSRGAKFRALSAGRSITEDYGDPFSLTHESRVPGCIRSNTLRNVYMGVSINTLVRTSNGTFLVVGGVAFKKGTKFSETTTVGSCKFSVHRLCWVLIQGKLETDPA